MRTWNKYAVWAGAVLLGSVCMTSAVGQDNLAASPTGRNALPDEVRRFIDEREICDHFRGEPFEGSRPEQVERSEFIRDSLDIYCSGTDRRLAALKRRYRNDQDVMQKLNGYEVQIEGGM